MPTTCGFPNCKFRSRYRGSDDIRHFYRVPKKPSHLRMKWLEAIGRTEETIVSQLRVCSGHFEGGEKKEGDVPVGDPSTDTPMKVDIPPKVPRTSSQNRRKREKIIKSGNHLIKTLKKNANEKSKMNSIIHSPKVPSNDIGFESAITCSKDNNFTSFMQSLLAPLIFSSSSNISNPISLLPYPMNSMSNNDMLNGVSSVLSLDRLSNILTPNSTSFDGHKAHLIIIDGNPLDWVFMDGLLNLTIFPTIEDAMFQKKAVSNADVIILWDNCALTKENIMHMPKLKEVIKLGCGVGLIDRHLLKQLDIRFVELISYCLEEVADNVMLAIIKLYRNGSTLNPHRFNENFLNEKQLNSFHQNIRPMASSCLGIIGGGPLSMAIANRSRAFGFHTIIFDSSKCCEYKWNNGIEHVESIEKLLRVCDCVVLNTSSDTVVEVTDQIILQMRPGSFIVDLLYSIRDNKSLATSSFLRSKHIWAIVQNYDYKAPRPNSDFTNLILTPLTQTLSPVCLQQLRESAVIEAQRCMKMEINTNNNASVDRSSKSLDESSDAPSTTVDSGLFSIKSLADN